MDCDVVVIGAGAIGLAIAREFAMTGQNVLIIEKCSSAGTATSSRNSEVIHAGIYYPAGSWKARLCVVGRKLMYDYCAKAGVGTKRVGKLIVAAAPQEEAVLNSISERAQANGVDDLQWLSANEAKALEPEVACSRALFSPSTGIVDSKAFMLALHADAEGHGATFSFLTQFRSARLRNGIFSVVASDTEGCETTVTCKMIVNCAGHGAHEVARSIEGIAAEKLPGRYFARGSYCTVTGKPPFRHLIYPIPVPGALGIHATVDFAGQVRLGPDIEWIKDLDYGLSPGIPERFAMSVRGYWPGVDKRELIASYCGVRPKIHGPREAWADFCMQDVSSHGIPGLFNLFGIESPGLTASLAIARHIVGHIQ